MKITLLAIGKTASSYLREGIDNYTRRIGYYVPFEFKVLPDIKNTRSLTEDRQKALEGESFMSVIRPGDHVVLLDERGREMTSRQFSGFISEKMTRLPGQLIFVIGGPYGFSDEMYRRADDKLSLSRMTFSHEMVRLFFVEQIYRAMTILRGEPYHHD
ncbi:MAG: 23S rRNA (pseudouridine(1915)-N(3))-methyltransferase RlmH [Pseudoflavonifractor sp.]|nr:23S rRNA (pseudouridine(1915)-N(3))-methyltransferase RlmH [Pseudoflavonifractor sp.]